jgi:integrase
MISSNPADRATPPGLRLTSVPAPDVSDLQPLIAAAGELSPLFALAVVLAAVTGAHRGELCALRWSDVDWERQLFRISRSQTEIGGITTEGPTKTHQRRDVALDDALLALLTKRRAEQQRYASIIGTVLVADPFILSPGASGANLFIPNTLTDYSKPLAKQLGITTAFPRAERLGHGDPSVT